MDRPKVARRERRLYISHDSTEQIYCATTYPLIAPNNSSIIVQGHADGVRISWRGGRPRKSHTSSHIDVIMINDSDDDQPSKDNDDACYEDEEQELDPDCPYPSIVHSLKVELGCAVTKVAVPSLAEITAAQGVHLLKTHILIVVACADGMIRAFTIPLSPPSDRDIRRRAEDCKKQAVILKSKTSTSVSGLAIKTRRVTSDAHQTRSRSRSQAATEGELLIASTSSRLNIWRLSLTSDGLQAAEQQFLQNLPLSAAGSRCSFHPSPRSTQMLVASYDGTVRLYDPFSPKSSLHGPSSRDSALPVAYSSADLGRWVMNYHTEFQCLKDDPLANPVLARRKRILDAKWVLNGKGVLVLLEDGEWGIWDLMTFPQSVNRPLDNFLLQGFLGSTAPSDTATAILKSGDSHRLAPMTPNTRKTKSAHLFSGPSKAISVSSTGGISISSTNAHNTSQPIEESVVMWYNSDIYTINNLTSFYQRGTSKGTATGGALGSLYAPGLTQIHDLNLHSESITSVSQFQALSTSAALSSFGQMNLQQRDLLIATDHRITIIQNQRGAATSRQLFQQPPAAVERPTPNDQAMLDVGMLDLGGMDRMLDSMANGGEIIGMRPRKVGFAGQMLQS
ncbi:hypothetical protein K431DRAFT_344649 [Polychaeton citri CBS 116435]|uniref:WD40 repeat-like protein n=1 Tax=Polychaeton citri CBS 116435 TaxID=1314669 RepID=A0A9P4QEV3_9PEZI|nr:hypothetical protein K431DRAFT_344649 [Polychaeton citri CBS 116435]